MADFHIVGGVTPRSAIYKSESHKLHHAFPLANGKNVAQGQPVVLLADGTVKGFESGDSLEKVIGYAATNSINPAYQPSRQHGPIDITVAVSGHAVLYGVSGGAINAGEGIKPNGSLDTTGKYTVYVGAVAPDRVVAIALNPATEAGEVIQLLFL